MPIYGEEKLLQISRSILPSKQRQNARFEKRYTARSERRISRQRLKSFEDYDELDFNIPIKRRFSFTVQNRRDADKLSHFERWAEKKANSFGDTPSERICKLRKILPKGLIGEHAISHLRWLNKYNVRISNDRGWRKIRPVSKFNELIQLELGRKWLNTFKTIERTITIGYYKQVTYDSNNIKQEKWNAIKINITFSNNFDLSHFLTKKNYWKKIKVTKEFLEKYNIDLSIYKTYFLLKKIKVYFSKPSTYLINETYKILTSRQVATLEELEKEQRKIYDFYRFS